MDIKTVQKDSFSVIGKEGSTSDGTHFVAALWQEANAHFDEIEPLAKRDAEGRYCGFWGLMSDFSKAFLSWEDGFSKGLYLAGAEVAEQAQAPTGWTKWTVPASEYLCAKITGEPQSGFAKVMQYMKENEIELVGAVYDYNAPAENGQLYMYFPVRRL